MTKNQINHLPESLLLIFFLTLISAQFANPQGRTINGIVISTDSIPLICAEVSIKGSKHAILTDSMGYFQIVVKPRGAMSIKAEGYETRHIKLKKMANDSIFILNIDFSETALYEKNRLIYKNSTQENVILVNSREVDISIYKDIYELIEERIPGVEVIDLGETKRIIIRGGSSMNQENDALIVIDEVIVSSKFDQSGNSNFQSNIMKGLRLRDILSIDIIADGTISMYGSQGGNGVVKIKTRKSSDY